MGLEYRIYEEITTNNTHKFYPQRKDYGLWHNVIITHHQYCNTYEQALRIINKQRKHLKDTEIKETKIHNIL